MAESDVDPFSPDDLRVMLEEEACTSEEKGWKFIKKNTEGDEIWRRSDSSTPVNLIKGFLKFPGIPPKDYIRRKWEKRFIEIEVLEEKPTHKVFYWRIAMPIGVSDRDVVQNVTLRRDESQDLTYILYKNTTHPEKPDVPGIVRAETILSGTLIRPDKDDPNSGSVTILLQNDPKGWIPAWAVNSFAANAPIEWKQSLSQYYHNEYKKN